MKRIRYVGMSLSSWEGAPEVEDCVKVTCSSQTRTYQFYFADMASVFFYRHLCRLVRHFYSSPFEIRTLRLSVGKILSLQAKFYNDDLSDFVHIKKLSVESDLEVWLLEQCDNKLFDALRPKLI